MADTQEQLLAEVSALGTTDFIRTVTNPITAPESTVIKKSAFVDNLFSDSVSLSISANTNDLTTTGLDTAHVLRLSSTGAFNVTGITTGSMGRVLFVHNVGTFTITLVDESTLSSLANRFALTNNVLVSPDTMVLLQYDSTSQRWRVSGAQQMAYSSLTGTPLVREMLTGNRTYYVRTDGNDGNNGLTNTSGGAFLTLQRAMQVISSLIDTNAYTVTVQVGDGTYTGGMIIVPWTGGGPLIIQGNTGNMNAVVISTVGQCFLTSAVLPNTVTIQYMKVQSSGSNTIDNQGVGTFNIGNLNFGTCGNFQVQSAGPGAQVQYVGNITISGNAVAHVVANMGGNIVAQSRANTISVPVTMTAFFIYCTRTSVAVFQSCTWTGSAVTGTRYSVDFNSVIYVGGGGANYFPGTLAGTAGSGGQYG